MTTLYKFIAEPEHVEFMLQGLVKFTPIPELNDPSELSPVLVTDDVRKSLIRLRREGYNNQEFSDLRRQEHLLKRLAPEYMRDPVPSSPEDATEPIRKSSFDDMPLLERMLHCAAQKISSKVGIFCLSRHCDSLPMWAHLISGWNMESEVAEKVRSHVHEINPAVKILRTRINRGCIEYGDCVLE